MANNIVEHQINLCILGSTGSIGKNTLKVVSQQQDKYRVFAVTANRNHQQLFQQCLIHEPNYAVMVNEDCASKLAENLKNASLSTIVLNGQKALCDMASHEQVDVVMASIVGAAGLQSTYAAIASGKRVLLANKESIVMAGDLMKSKAKQTGSQIVPVDSEHNAIMQCLPDDFSVVHQSKLDGVSKIILTGSGGPFRQLSPELLVDVTPQQACAHPNWKMGKKISVDSATMMNKALELIETCQLFDIDQKDVQIVVHPQSIIHSMVQYIDGSILAQMGVSDMRIPIASALAWPDRIKSGADNLSLFSINSLTFHQPNLNKYPFLSLVREVIDAHDNSSCIMSAANEVAVDAFLNSRINYTSIYKIVVETIEKANFNYALSLESILEVDYQSRLIAAQILKSYYK